MTRTFKYIDRVYEVRHGDCHGEIVGVSISFTDQGWIVPISPVCWKAKTRAFPASTNAFFMHRGICKALRSIYWYGSLTSTRQRDLKRSLFAAIFQCYLLNASNDVQGFEVVINVGKKSTGGVGKVGLNESSFLLNYAYKSQTFSLLHIVDDEGDTVLTHIDGVPVNLEFLGVS